jgi:hypothetical protein
MDHRLNIEPESTTPSRRGWLSMHESGTYVCFTQFGTDLFA